jgi:hypothetical protein
MAEIASIETIDQRIARLKAQQSVIEQRLDQQRQRHSFARAEAGIGSDADELAYRAALSRGDTEEMTRLDAGSQQRMAAFVARFPKQDNG